MSKETEIKKALSWVIRRGYAPIHDDPEKRAEGFVSDFREDKTPCFTQLFSTYGESQLQPGRSYSVDEIYYMYINDPER